MSSARRVQPAGPIGGALSTDDIAGTLLAGELTVEGRLVDASNVTLLCTVTVCPATVCTATGPTPPPGAAAETMTCVYKPRAGERPLWDFPTGTLAGREVATYELSQALGWRLVPPTVLRDGPFGPGMCQLWVDDDTAHPHVDVVADDAVPTGWVTAVQALDEAGEVVRVVHAADPDVRRTALLDIVANNADRKGSHLLSGPDGLRVVDHGLCFHAEPKLRTVLWGFGGSRLDSGELEALQGARSGLAAGRSLHTTLADLLTAEEIDLTGERVDGLLAAGRFPLWPGGWRSLPWPPL